MQHSQVHIDLGEGVYCLDQTIIDLEEISSLIIEQIQSNPYYSDVAKDHEAKLYSPASLEKLLSEDPYSVLVSQTEDSIVTGVLVSKFDCYTRWMNWVLTRPGYRRLGYANRLLKALKLVSAKTECHKIWCDSRPTNTESLRLLHSNNFREVAKLHRHWYSLDFILLEYNLTDAHG